jgi:hypothetical protein
MDPLSPVVNHSLGNMYNFAERFDDTIRQGRQVAGNEPGDAKQY